MRLPWESLDGKNIIHCHCFFIPELQRREGGSASKTGASYPFSGAGLRYAHSNSNLREVVNLSLIDDTDAHSRSRAPTSQEIRGQPRKN